MGKPPYMYTDSETDDTSISSIENVKKKKRFSFATSILKYTNGNVKKKKCKIHSKSEPEDSDYHSRSRSRVRYKLPGILKNSNNNNNNEKEKERYIISSASEDEDIEPPKPPRNNDRYLVGRVPRPAGAKPGRGGGVAIIVKKNVSALQSQQCSTTAPKKKVSSYRRVTKKRSY